MQTSGVCPLGQGTDRVRPLNHRSFDEPEDLNTVPEREIITPEQLAARLEEEKKAASWFGKFRKGKSKKSTPLTTADMTRQASEARPSSTEPHKSYEYGYDYDEKIAERFSLSDSRRPSAMSEPTRPTSGDRPRTSEDSNTAAKATSSTGHGAETGATAAIPSTLAPSETTTSTAPPASSQSDGPGFDIEKIRQEIHKDDGSGQLPVGSLLKTPFRSPLDKRPSAPSIMSSSATNMSQTDLSKRDEAVAAAMAIVEQQKAQELLEKQEEEYERALAARNAADAVLYSKNRLASSSEMLSNPDGSASVNSPYSFSNPFAASTASFGGPEGSSSAFPAFSFDSPITIPPTNMSAISFGGDDGTIEFGPSTSAGDRGEVDAPWRDGDGFKTSASASDPWAGNEWGTTPKW